MKQWWMARGLILSALILSSGCGYRAGSLVPSDIHTVHVAMFDNATFRRGLEFQLTEAVQREIRRRTHLVFTDRNTADSVLTGEIVDFQGSLLVRDPNFHVIAKDVTITISFKWIERRTGRVLAEAPRISKTVRLYATRGETVGTASAESFRWLAEEVVDRMEGGW